MQKLQCKNIPDIPILEFLAGETDNYEGWTVPGWAGWFSGSANNIKLAMPEGVNDKLMFAKLKQLKQRGLIDGCCCGCRGDFKITPKGQEYLQMRKNEPTNTGD